MNSVSDSLKWVVAAAVAVGLGLASAHAQDKKAGDTQDSKSSSQARDTKAAKEDKKASELSRSDRSAMEKMAQSDMAEVQAGKVAQQKASNPEVKKYAEHMVQEHSKALEEGKQLASTKGVTPPKETDRKHRNALEKLERTDRDSFDRAYMRQMVQDHEDALKLVRKTAKDAKDPQLKAHAEKMAPHIEEHLAQARKINDSLSGDKPSKSNTKSDTRSETKKQ